MEKAIVSAPAFALASRIACRKEPAPLSVVLVTVNVDSASRSSRHSTIRRAFVRTYRLDDVLKRGRRHAFGRDIMEALSFAFFIQYQVSFGITMITHQHRSVDRLSSPCSVLQGWRGARSSRATCRCSS